MIAFLASHSIIFEKSWGFWARRGLIRVVLDGAVADQGDGELRKPDDLIE